MIQDRRLPPSIALQNAAALELLRRVLSRRRLALLSGQPIVPTRIWHRRRSAMLAVASADPIQARMAHDHAMAGLPHNGLLCLAWRRATLAALR